MKIINKAHICIWVNGFEYGEIVCVICGKKTNPFLERQLKNNLKRVKVATK